MKHDANGHPTFPEEFFNLVFQNTVKGNSLDVQLSFRGKNEDVHRFPRPPIVPKNDEWSSEAVFGEMYRYF
jgi:hypothetical protein